jgi:hypothetical protein
MTTLRTLSCIALLTSACGPDASDAPAPALASVRDSAGITIVENPALSDDTSPAWTVGPSPVVEIGVLDGPEEYQLFRVRDARKLADGRIAVLNAGSQEVRTYGADGTYLATWGGRGEGPGEFLNPASLSWWPGDSVAVWDGRLRRLALFAHDGALGRALTFPAVRDMPTPLFSHVLADGNPVVRMTIFPADGPSDGLTRQPVAVAVVDPDGSLVASLGTHPGREGFMRVTEGSVAIFIMPTYRGAVIEAAGSSSIIGATDRFELEFWAGDGSLTRIVRVATPARLMTDAERSAELERRLAAAPEEARPGIRATFGDIPMRDTLPAFSGVVVDDSRHVWMRPFRLPVDGGPEQWLVLDPEGQALGHITLPEGLTVYEIGADYILGAATDDLGVERVQVWPLRRR